MIGRLRAIGILLVLATVTPPTMVVQWVLLKTHRKAATWLPVAYHRFVCRVLDIRIDIRGKLDQSRPLLLVGNHISWLDIPILSAAMPVSFVAKSEINRWPFFGSLARLQRSIFVNRQRRTHTGEVANAMNDRLAEGDLVLLFAEGTSSHGNLVLPYRASLFAAVMPSDRLKRRKAGQAADAPEPISGDGDDTANASPTFIQPVAISYTHLCGLPMGRQHRPLVSWAGNIDLVPHFWGVLKSGPLDVVVSFGEAFNPREVGDRKAAAKLAFEQTSRLHAEALHGERKQPEPIASTNGASETTETQKADATGHAKPEPKPNAARQRLNGHAGEASAQQP